MPCFGQGQTHGVRLAAIWGGGSLIEKMEKP